MLCESSIKIIHITVETNYMLGTDAKKQESNCAIGNSLGSDNALTV